MLKKAIRTTMLGVLLSPVPAMALGMGGVSVHSQLGQPLKVDISLVGANVIKVHSIKAGLAPPSVFSEFSLPHPDYLNALKFNVVKNKQGNPEVRINTSGPINQPFLDFLVEVKWPGGRLVREYTILLNPPSFMGGQSSVSVSKPKAQVHLKRSNFHSSNMNLSSTKPNAENNVVSSANSSVTYRVKKGDDLFRIALNHRSSSKISVAQMMIAILRQNPRAFIDSNINGLQTGYILRIPSRSESLTVSRKAADALVQKQNALWRQYVSKLSGHMRVSEKSLGPQKNSHVKANSISEKAKSSAAQGKKSSAPKKARLKILGVGKNNHHEVSQASPLGVVQKQAVLAQETALSNQQQILGLEKKIDDLQGIVGKQLKLIELKNRQLSALQAKVDETPSHPLMSRANSSRESSQSGSMIGFLLSVPDLWLYASAVVLILLGLLLIKVRRTRKKSAKSSPDDPADTNKLVDASLESVRLGTTNDFEAKDNHDVAETKERYDDQQAHEQNDSNNSSTSELEDLDLTHIDSDEKNNPEDISAEVDVYIAYGLYQQAEDLLRKFLDSHEDRNDIRLKLLEVFHASKNTEGFLDQAGLLYQRLSAPQTDPIWNQASLWGRELAPENELFEDGGISNPNETNQSAHDLEFDAEPDIDEETAITGSDQFDSTSENLPEIEEDALSPLDDETSVLDALGEVNDEADPTLIGERSQVLSDHSEQSESNDENVVTDNDEDLTLPDFDFDLGELDISPSDSESESEQTETKIDEPTKDDALDLEFDVPDLDDLTTEEAVTSSSLKGSEQAGNLSSIDIDSNETNSVTQDSAAGDSALEETSATMLLDEGAARKDLDSDIALEQAEEKDQDADLAETMANNIKLDDLSDPADQEVTNSDISLDDEDGDYRDSNDTSELADTDTIETTVDDLLDSASRSVDENKESSTTELDFKTQLDLARAYMEMGDIDGAKDTLAEIIEKGDPEAKSEAQKILAKIS